MAYQTGFRHFVSNLVQLDFTVGMEIAGQNQLPFWGGVGVRLVTDWYEKKHIAKKSSN